jgi:hydrogenase 3 maturation protease
MTASAKSSLPRSTILVLGIGNVLKGDDGVGPYVAGLLAESLESGGVYHKEHLLLHAIDCGTVPENYTSVVRRLRPDHLVLVDAAEMGLAAGEVRVVPVEMIGALGLSTHSMPLSMFMSYVADLAGSVILVGVQPYIMHLGCEMCEAVRVAGEELVRMLRDGDMGQIPSLGEDTTRR